MARTYNVVFGVTAPPAPGSDRDSLVSGTYFPGATQTGPKPGVLLTKQTTSQTFSANGAYVRSTDFDGGRISLTGQNQTFEDCIFRGDNSANALVTMTNINVRNAKFIDCKWLPRFPQLNNSINGHDFTLFRCDLGFGTDIVQIQNGAQFTATGPGWDTGVLIQQSYLHDMARWTASTGGIVHPSDVNTHNDLVQQFGGINTRIIGSTLDARPAMQYAHFVLWRSSDSHIYTAAEVAALPDNGPFIQVPNGTLADGGPFQPVYVNNGTNSRLLGMLDSPDWSGLMINNTQGYSAQFTFDDNLCMGGEFFTNGGGNANPGGGINLGNFRRNAFTRDQGNQGSGTGNGHTLDFGGTWSGFVTAPTTGTDMNYYLDDGSPITVRR